MSIERKIMVRNFPSRSPFEWRYYRLTEEALVLRALATLPQYQGTGCGSALLQWGLEKVDADRKRVFLEATPQGHSLYAKFGWKDVDEMVFDLKDFGFNGHVQKIICMMRDATK